MPVRLALSVSCVLATSGGVGSAAGGDAPPAVVARPRSVIFIMCDGMGPGMFSTASELTRDSRGMLAMETMPVTGFVRTASLTGPITDSAAAASAFATGWRVKNSALNWLDDGSSVPSLVDMCEARGMATGLLTTTDFTDASPAAFVARVPTRHNHPEIYAQMVRSSVDLIVGGARTATLQNAPKGDIDPKTPVVPLSDALRQRANQAGRVVLVDPLTLPAQTDGSTRVLVAPPERTPYDDAFGPKMDRTLRAALGMLSSDPDGFFVFAEVEETDNAGHANDADRAVAGVLEGDEALKVALEYQRSHPDTLIVLTADHDTGSMSLDNRGDYKSGTGGVAWVSKNHTASRVPVFASGPGAERFTGTHENSELFTIVRDLLGLDAGGATAWCASDGAAQAATGNTTGTTTGSAPN